MPHWLRQGPSPRDFWASHQPQRDLPLFPFLKIFPGSNPPTSRVQPQSPNRFFLLHHPAPRTLMGEPHLFTTQTKIEFLPPSLIIPPAPRSPLFLTVFHRVSQGLKGACSLHSSLSSCHLQSHTELHAAAWTQSSFPDSGLLPGLFPLLEMPSPTMFP